MKTELPFVTVSVHATYGKIGGFNIHQHGDFATANFGDFSLFFDHHIIPIMEQILDVARSMAPRTDSLRNDSPRIQESEERILPEKGNENNPDEQSGSALDIPF